jgi:hypothetical protein
MTPAALADDALGIASGVVAAIGTGCYVRGWQRGEALPSQVSWTWWTLVSAAVTGALALHHAPWPLLVMPAESAAGCGLIFVLSLVRGADRWDAAARFMTVGVIAAIPVWLIYPHATAAVALSAAVEVAGDVPTIGGAWRNPRAEPASSWACVAISGVLSLGAATLTPGGQAAGYLLPAAWVLGGVSIPAAATLGSRARRVPGRRESGRRESARAACFLALAPVPLAAMALAGFEVITGTSVRGIPVVASSGVAKPPRPIVLPAQTGRQREPAPTRRPVLAALLPPAPPHAARPSPSRTRKLSPQPSSPRPSSTRTPDPTSTSTSPYPCPTTATPSPVPTGSPYPSPTTATPSPVPTASPSPSPSSAGTPSPTPSPTQTYPSPTATATPNPGDRWICQRTRMASAKRP